MSVCQDCTGESNLMVIINLLYTAGIYGSGEQLISAMTDTRTERKMIF